ncbi:beta-1,4-glucuronyltransferase 1-like [Sitodiplosis mosellana]|uniref:beta-1,4-glucuronyltransferase 1-like n=1 Tax=Sitodiplosis mosellana TaxID=263140 RepID=UPI002444664F|nr:beta-1,4-glucuronyltransferase 1-like [Sitodiplosis mosellana]
MPTAEKFLKNLTKLNSVKDHSSDEKEPKLNHIESIKKSEDITSTPENGEYIETNLDAQLEFEMKTRDLTSCMDKNFEPRVYRRGDYWVLQNYIRAVHGEIRCTESVTYVTHGDYTFLDNVIPVLERWLAPLSMSIYTPGTDLQPTIDSIKYLRQCLSKSHLVRKLATFHIFFDSDHMPNVVPKSSEVLSEPYYCSLPPPYLNVKTKSLYKNQQNMIYPINVARNSARDAALTHFIFVSDIELYPSPDLPRTFLEMIVRNDPPFNSTKPKVFPLGIFEVDKSSPVPWTKTELQDLYKKGKIIPFHKQMCGNCHRIPEADKWMQANETEGLDIFTVGKRKGNFRHWEPIFIGTNDEPYYDERLSWEGKSDKMTQSRIV